MIEKELIYFKNDQELLNHLIKGGAITNLDRSCYNCFVALDFNGNLLYSDGTDAPFSIFGNSKNWRPVCDADLVKIIMKDLK